MRCPHLLPVAIRRWGWLIVGCVWLVGIAGGLSLIARHEATAGIAGAAPRDWPSESCIPLSDSGHTLIMFAHPRCPCTRTSLGELAAILERGHGEVNSWIVFFEPSDVGQDWHQTCQWFTAAQIPNVRVLRDVDGTEATRFHAVTSGQTLLYSSAGELVFSGGITVARGHAGDNAGRCAILSLLSNSAPDTRRTPVFGCPILVPSERE